jgi:DNA polymerase III delta prime subunit
MSNTENTLWVEKYRPKALDDLLLDKVQKQKFEEYIKKQDIPHIGLFGKAGRGKTTLAKILVNSIDCDFIYINATEDRSIDVIKEKVGGFAAAGTFKPLKIVILDESTHILEASQVLLLNMIETFSLKTRFILTGNFPERLIEPLRSRLQEFDLKPPTKSETAKHLSDILVKEKVEFETGSIKIIINQNYPDIRSIVNAAQKSTLNNKLQPNENASLDGIDYKEQILKELTITKSINNIRQTLVNTNLSDYSELYKFLYKNVDKIAPKNIGEAIITIEEYKYRSTSRVDQEITIASCLAKLSEIIK